MTWTLLLILSSGEEMVKQLEAHTASKWWRRDLNLTHYSKVHPLHRYAFWRKKVLAA